MANDPFAPLRAEYLESAQQRLAEVERLAPLAAGNEAARAELRKLAHNLRGSGGFYGFHAISAAAAALEELILAGNSSGLIEAAEQLCEAIRRPQHT